MRGKKERTATKEQSHNAMKCHLQMNTCSILTACHVPCIPSCEGENNMRGRGENGNSITTTQCNAISLADEWMHYTHSLSCSMHS